MMLRRILRGVTRRALDMLAAPLVLCASVLLLKVRQYGVHSLPLCRASMLRVQLLPVTTHYYEPLPKLDEVVPQLSCDRSLPGVRWNGDEQVAFLKRLYYAQELQRLECTEKTALSFSYHNDNFGPGDAEVWYSMIRVFKPRRILEIGSGHSTKMARHAISANRQEDAAYECEHICIEPYEMSWLEGLGPAIVRKRVEEVDIALFQSLAKNDILFIDSSHVIRPRGDVLMEYINVLPQLKVGVIVHVHDIFSPKDYPAEWYRGLFRLWNEQYLLEALLTDSDSFTIIAALNWLYHSHFDELKHACPFLRPDSQPASFYIRRTSGPSGALCVS